MFSHFGTPTFNLLYYKVLTRSSDLYCTMCTSLFIPQPQHHPSTLNPICTPSSPAHNKPQCQRISKYSQPLLHKENSKAGERKETMEGGEQEKKRSKEKIRLR